MHSSEFRTLIDELKLILKSRKMTYQDLAAAVGMSEAGIKRIFSSNDGKLSTLSKMCEALGFGFIDLVSASKISKKKVNFLTDEQDHAFAKNFDLYIFFNELVVRKKSKASISKDHGLSAGDISKYMLALERLGVLRTTAKGNTTIAIRAPIGIRKEGKLRKLLVQRFARSVTNQLVSESAESLGHPLHTREWMLSPSNTEKFKENLQHLILEFDQVSARDEGILPPEALVPVSLIAGFVQSSSPYGKISKPLNLR